MHFHHRHDIAGCVDAHGDWPDWAVTLLATLDRKEIQLMSQLQDSIDGLAQNFATALAAISAEIDSLKAQVAAGAEPTADLSGLEQALAQAQALVPAPAPAPAPADGGVVDGGGAADSGGTTVDGGGAADVPAPSVPSVPLA